MPWQLHATDRLRAEYGDDRLRQPADRLEDILRQNDLPVPEFPAMIWALETLPGGVEVAVGIARDEDEMLAYVWPSDKIQFVGTETVTLEHRAEDGSKSVVLFHRYSPKGG